MRVISFQDKKVIDTALKVFNSGGNVIDYDILNDNGIYLRGRTKEIYDYDDTFYAFCSLRKDLKEVGAIMQQEIFEQFLTNIVRWFRIDVSNCI
jgi:hypothetical protein